MNKKLFARRGGIMLDVGCGLNKEPGFIGMDKRRLKGVEIVWDVQKFPWKPIPNDVCIRVVMSHLWEHIEPKYRMRLMDELWRVTKPEGQLFIAAPYYMSPGAAQDPTHYPCPNEATFTYFDPKYSLYDIYQPKPWKLVVNDYRTGGIINVVLEKIRSAKERERLP